jgi:hypothetical protein
MVKKYFSLLELPITKYHRMDGLDKFVFSQFWG